MDSSSCESGSQFSKSEKSASPEICKRWSSIVFKVYERMIHSSEVSFFVSSPQIISSLGFILGVCNANDTEGLADIFDGCEENTDIDYLIDHTLKFVHRWSGELRNMLAPGQYHRARRVYAHPKFVNPHNENTFQFFRLFRAEEKIFEGFGEVRKWASRSLKTDFTYSQKMLNMWPREQNDYDEMQKQRKAGEFSSNVRLDQKKNDSNRGVKTEKENKTTVVAPISNRSGRSRKDSSEVEKKSPILAWLSHALVEIPDEYFDGKYVYTWNQQEYLRIHSTPTEPICIKAGKFDFNALMVPTQNRQLSMIIFYEYDAKLCSLEGLRLLVSDNFQSRSPCIVRKKGDKEVSSKRSVYVPHWKTKDFPASRIAQHLVASIDLHSLFVAGGFGDLAVADAVPSATGDPKKISHLQHFGLLSFRNSPKKSGLSESEQARGKTHRKASKRKEPIPVKVKVERIRMNEGNANQIEIIRYPICVVLWDRNRELPAYMGKVTGTMTEQEIEEIKQLKLNKKQKKKLWCC